jgi:hypothetical protein
MQKLILKEQFGKSGVTSVAACEFGSIVGCGNKISYRTKEQ